MKKLIIFSYLFIISICCIAQLNVSIEKISIYDELVNNYKDDFRTEEEYLNWINDTTSILSIEIEFKFNNQSKEIINLCEHQIICTFKINDTIYICNHFSNNSLNQIQYSIPICIIKGGDFGENTFSYKNIFNRNNQFKNNKELFYTINQLIETIKIEVTFYYSTGEIDNLIEAESIIYKNSYNIESIKIIEYYL